MSQAPVLYPTWEEFIDFSTFIENARKRYSKYGIIKIVPPKEWEYKCTTKETDFDDIVIDTPINQVVSGTKGYYQQFNIERGKLSVKEFREEAQKMDKLYKINDMTHQERERCYWRNVSMNPPIYGADMQGSLFGKDVKVWNLNRLDSILNSLDVDMPGINSPYLYWGMWKSTFAWHIEDMELYSINFLHFGKPKSWYCIPPHESTKFEKVASVCSNIPTSFSILLTVTQFLFPAEFKQCKQFLRHKQSLISPYVLKSHNITVHSVVQEQGQFVVTFPYSYHAGFNHGFNCAEAVNFAVRDWIPYGIVSVPCKCDKDRAHIDMEQFLNKYKTSEVSNDEDIDFYVSSYRRRKYNLLDHTHYPKLIVKFKKSSEDDGKLTLETRTVPRNLNDLKVIK